MDQRPRRLVSKKNLWQKAKSVIAQPIGRPEKSLRVLGLESNQQKITNHQRPESELCQSKMSRSVFRCSTN